jgi:hypothetical protein
MLEQIPLPYSLFLIPYLLFKFSSPTVETVGYGKCRKNWICKMLERAHNFPLGGSRGPQKNPGCISQPGFLLFMRVLKTLFSFPLTSSKVNCSTF